MDSESNHPSLGPLQFEWSLSKGFKIVKESTGKLEGHVGIVVHALEISVVHQ